MNHPYRATELALVPPAAPKPLRCYLGLHRPACFAVTKSNRFICVGVKVTFFCACGKNLATRHAPTKRPVTLNLGSMLDWDGMGGRG